MIETKDVISFIVGLGLFVVGTFNLLAKFKIGPSWFNMSQFLSATIVIWIIAVGALYLVINSIIEITNSSAIGTFSIIVAFICLALGLLPALFSFGIGPSFFQMSFLGAAKDIIFNVALIAEGIFLMIAMIAMEM